MTETTPRASRWRHFRNSLTRQSRGRSKDTIAIAVLVALGVVMTLWIFTQQKASLPSWVPFVGEEFVHVSGDFTTAQAVTPGQGQAVDIAGIQIGKVTSVNLEDGHAVVGMDIEPKYLELIHPNATLLLRPKTNLNDMIVEVDPGSGKGHIEDGLQLPALAHRTERQPRRLPGAHSTPTRASTSSCWSPAAPRASAAAAISSPARCAACSPSPTTSPTSTAPWPGVASPSLA